MGDPMTVFLLLQWIQTFFIPGAIVLGPILFFAVFWVLRRLFSLPKVTTFAMSGTVAVSLILFVSALFVSDLSNFVFGARDSTSADRASVVEEPVRAVQKAEVAHRLPQRGALLPSNAEPEANVGLFGLILLVRMRPDNKMVCHRFYSIPITINERRFMRHPTYWPDRRQAGKLPHFTNCGDLVKNYDWIWANAVLNRLGLDGAAGPVLVAYGPAPNERGKLTRTILDLSSCPTSELALAFEGWIQSITSDPGDWRRRSFADVLREDFWGLHNYLIKHGDSLSAALVNPGDLARRASADSPRDRQEQLPQTVEIDLSR